MSLPFGSNNDDQATRSTIREGEHAARERSQRTSRGQDAVLRLVDNGDGVENVLNTVLDTVLDSGNGGDSSASAAFDRFGTQLDVGPMQFWRPPQTNGTDLICGEGSTQSMIAHHAHEALQVLLPMSRFAVIGGEARCCILSPGVVHLTSPSTLFAARCIGEAIRVKLLLVGPALLAKVGLTAELSALGSRPVSLAIAGDDYQDLLSTFDGLRCGNADGDDLARLIACLRRLLARAAAREAPADTAISDRLVRAREYVLTHAVTKLSLDEIARAACLSKFHLLRAFRRAYGVTPHGYQMQLRLARARRLIGEGLQLSYAAYDAGFADQSHLTRRFAAFYAMTPARYARQLGQSFALASDADAALARRSPPPYAA